MDFEDVLQPERLRAGAERDGVLHRDDVAEDRQGGIVGLLGLGACEAPPREDQALDAGRRDGLGAEQTAGEDLKAREPRRVTVQSTARSAVETAAAMLDGSGSSMRAIGSGMKARC